MPEVRAVLRARRVLWGGLNNFIQHNVLSFNGYLFRKMEVLDVLDNRQYDPVGHCIYCGAMNNLQKEHILPFGLSGTATLPSSTCSKCATVTGEQERRVLRGFMYDLRIYLGLKSRSKYKNAPQEYPLTIIREGVQETVMLPLDEYPILLAFPVFSPPAFLNPSGYTNGIRIKSIETVSFGPKPAEVLRNLGATSISQTQDQEPVSFARVIAKIAYALAAAKGDIDKIKGDPLVLPAILGNTDDIGRWVGTLDYPRRVFDGQLHRIQIHEDCQKGLLIGDVQLFSNSPAPRYGVIIGILR